MSQVRDWRPRHGALYLGQGTTRFRVWAPGHDVELHLLTPTDRYIPMKPDGCGYHEEAVAGTSPGDLYRYRLDGGEEWPDPASRSQPEGPHGPSQIVDPEFAWTDEAWAGVPLERYVVYEAHVGAFTGEGTFRAMIPELPYLRELGITVLELMPVAQFPGERNWGYDGVFPYAAQTSYGGIDGLRSLVDACHAHGLAVCLDVVHNHLGPEGNYFSNFGPYFTDRYRTPWGAAINYDGPESDEVRAFFIENALYWTLDCHIDALRLDAVHAIADNSPVRYLEELAATVHRRTAHLSRPTYVIAESDMNDRRIVAPPEVGGYGLDAQWSDDFHHALHAVLTGERAGYYHDFGEVEQLARAVRDGFVYQGEYSPYRRRRHGSSSDRIAGKRLVVAAQNHDQVGNRMLGERLSSLVPFEALKVAAGLLLTIPYVPLLFMGEEYGETAPFQYFISHSDPELVEAVRRGRSEEFAAFSWQGDVPDPQAEETFRRSKLNRALQTEPRHAALLALHRELLRLRRDLSVLRELERSRTHVAHDDSGTLVVRRWSEEGEFVAAFRLRAEPGNVALPLAGGPWRKLLDSEEERWQGAGSAVPPTIDSAGSVVVSLAGWSFVMLYRER